MADEKIITLTKANFEQEVLKSDSPIMVDFWASWCGPCRAVAPIMDELANEYDGKAKIGKINVDEEGELAARFKIMSIPTIILFANGQAKEKVIGAKTKEEFSQVLMKNL